MEVGEEKEPFVYLCPECGKPIDVSAVSPFAKIECPHCSAHVRARTTMGQYQIVGLLGEGGMSQVFRAIDMNLGREVALKILHQSLSDDSALTSMFEREAKLTASIVHPNVVKVFTVGKDHGYFFIAMEVVNAISLEQLIHNKGALSESEVLNIANDVTRGLMAAYGEDLIHRDIKPGNMLVCGDGTTKLVDFGLAVQQGGADESEDLWATPFYVPPEKLEGLPDTFLGDIYSLGATLFHALAGRPPFEANTASMEELKEIKKSVVDLKNFAPGLSKPTIKLVEKMMAYDPAARHASYEEVLSQIEEIQKRLFGVVPGGRVRKAKSGKRFAIAGTVVLLAAAALSAGIFFSGEQVTEGEEGGLGLGTGSDERVVTVGDNTVAEQFLSARGLFVGGKFQEAGKAFDELIARESVPASIQLWSYFLRGTVHLIRGEEAPSRKAFSRVIEITPGAEEDGTAEAVAFLKKAAIGLVDPLPMLEDEVKFSADSVEALGIFAAGLKNWQAGEFESGVRLFDAFAASQPPSAYEWIAGLKAHVDPFLRDYKIFESLPNPSAAGSDSVLADQEKSLKRAVGSITTAGAAPERVNERLQRIVEIRKLAAKRVPNPVASSVAPVKSPTESPRTNPTASVPDPIEEKEIEQLKELAISLQASAGSLQFAESLTALQSRELTSVKARAIRDGLIEAFTGASLFLETLVEALNATRYEGVVRRREGVPLDAAITSATPTALVLDLGFGPNEVGMEAFAPDWLLEAAMRTFPPVSAGTVEDWERLVYFGLVIGRASAVESRSKEMAAIDPEFGRQWDILLPIR